METFFRLIIFSSRLKCWNPKAFCLRVYSVCEFESQTYKLQRASNSFSITFLLASSRSICQPFCLARELIDRDRRPSYWFHKRNLNRCFLILPWNQLFQLSPVGAGIFRTRFELIPSSCRLSIPRAIICIQMRGSSSRDYARDAAVY